MLVSEGTELVYMLVGDSPAAPAYVPLATIEAYMHEAVALAARRAFLCTMEVELELLPGTAEALLPEGFMQLEAAEYDGVHLEPSTKFELQRIDEEWATRIGSPSIYYLDEIQGKIGIWRRPESQGAVTGSPDAPTDLDFDVETVAGGILPPDAPTDLSADPEGA